MIQRNGCRVTDVTNHRSYNLNNQHDAIQLENTLKNLEASDIHAQILLKQIRSLAYKLEDIETDIMDLRHELRELLKWK